MGLFERYLTVWVGLGILAGVGLGLFAPGAFQAIAGLEFAQVNLVVAVFIWVMIYPMMIQIDWHAVRDVGKRPQGLILTLVVNWLVKPFTMAALGVLFFQHLFAPWVDPASASAYIAGMILLGVAPCTAMVFVWSQLVKGDPNYTLVQVSVNDLIMVFAFAPIAAFLLGVTDLTVPWETLLLSTVLYVVLPLLAGMATRRVLERRAAGGGSATPAKAVVAKAVVARAAVEKAEGAGGGKLADLGNAKAAAVGAFVGRLKPWSIVGLIATVVLLFGFQARTIVEKPLVIGLIAVPLLVQTYGIFLIAYLAAKAMKLPHDVAGPACLIGTSNFFELAVAVAISLFGLNSGAALATVVGVLVEVPVMLSLVAIVNRTRHWFAPRGAPT
jgi:arsenite transporter